MMAFWRRMSTTVKLIRCIVALLTVGLLAADPQTAKLAKEVAGKGWIVFSGKTAGGDWDLFVMRPDGSHKRNISNTPNFNEIGVRVSPDGSKLLYRRVAPDVRIRHDSWGTLGNFVIANSDGTNPRVYGDVGEFPW